MENFRKGGVFLKTDRYTSLCEKINEIIEITDKVPSELKIDVFRTLFEAVKEGSAENLFAKEIMEVSANRQSVQEFIAEKKPVSNIERTLLFVYYLESLSIEGITAKHIATCYELCNLNEPGNLTQNLRDACSARYGYLQSEQNFFRTTQKGKEFCES